jgi:Ca2+-dependent lipid-binding protein
MNTEYVWLLGKILLYTVSFYLGRLNFSLAWLMPFIYSTIQDHFNQKRRVQKAATQAALRLDERDIILSRLDDIPAWVLFPDFERVEWINKIVRRLWPTVNYFVSNMVTELEPMLHQHNLLRTFKFVKIDLGQIVSLELWCFIDHVVDFVII